jgi:hypothetical protein
MIKISYNLEIIDDTYGDKLQERLEDEGISFDSKSSDDFIITIDSIEKYKKIQHILARHLIDIKWEEVIEDVFYDVFNMYYEDLNDFEKNTVEAVKNFKRLEIVTKKTLDEYMCIKDNNSISIGTFSMFNMDGFEDMLKNEFINVDFETIHMKDAFKDKLVKEWKNRGILLEDYKEMYILKDKEHNSFHLYNQKNNPVTYNMFVSQMGFEIANIANIRNEKSKYLTMILNISRYFNTEKIYVDERECKEIADLLVSNTSFEGNHAQIILSTKDKIEEIKKRG